MKKQFAETENVQRYVVAVNRMYGKAVALGLLLLTLPGITDARKTEPTMEAVVERVVDGDTIKVVLVGDMARTRQRQFQPFGG